MARLMLFPKIPWQRPPPQPVSPLPPAPTVGFGSRCGAVTLLLRFHFCSPRWGNLHLSVCKPPGQECLGPRGGDSRMSPPAVGVWLSSLSVSRRSALRRKAAFSTLSILVALLIAGQAVTIYFVYQQSGQISKLTKTSQKLQLDALQMKMPANAKPVNKMKMAKANTPLVMRSMNVLHPAPFEDFPVKAPASNKTEDQVKHLLLQADPSRMFPELEDNLMDNLKRLKSTMTYTDWQSFESWMHKWLLFQMAKNPKSEDRKAIPAEKGTAAPSAVTATTDTEEMIFSGVDMLKLNAGKTE
uniref:CD74 molecule n=1 Tax=Catharus ustulatus TaxID=91951 RepID=A0A8C3USD9_CATUS